MNTAALRARVGAGLEAAVAWFGAMERRLLLVLLGALVAFSAFEAWVLLLRAPLAEYRTLAAARAAAGATAPAVGLEAEIERLKQRSAAQARELAPPADDGSDDEAVLRIIETLGELAVRHDVVLGRVSPVPRAVLGGFDERAYTVEARGEYRALHAWLGDARRALAPLAVAELALRAADGGSRVALTARLAGYRAASAPPAKEPPR